MAAEDLNTVGADETTGLNGIDKGRGGRADCAIVSGIDGTRSVFDQQPDPFDRDIHIDDQERQRLVMGDRLAEGDAIERVRARKSRRVGEQGRTRQLCYVGF